MAFLKRPPPPTHSTPSALRSDPMQKWMRRIWFDSWIIEIFAMSLCVASAVALSVVLLVYDQKPLPPLPRTLTMNAIIAILSTVSKSSLLLVVSSCISQLKWKWYQDGRKLGDIQLFEDASRGPFGAIQMLIHHRTRSTACFGAAILVIALAFEPFVQQIPSFQVLPMFQPSNLAIAPRALSFLPGITNTSDIPLYFTDAVIAGIWFNDFDDLKPVCPVSNCRWDTFSSLGLCSSCGPSNPQPKMDCSFDRLLSNQSSPSDDPVDVDYSYACNITLRNNITEVIKLRLRGIKDYHSYIAVIAPRYQTITVYNSFPVLRGENHDFFNDTIQGITNPLSASTTIHFGMSETSLYVESAEDCTIHFCARDYSMDTTNDTANIRVSNVHNLRPVTPILPDPVSKWGPACWATDNETFSSDTYNISAENSRFETSEVSFSFCTPAAGSYVVLGNLISQHVSATFPQVLRQDCWTLNNGSQYCLFSGPELVLSEDLASFIGAEYAPDNVAF